MKKSEKDNKRVSEHKKGLKQKLNEERNRRMNERLKRFL